MLSVSVLILTITQCVFSAPTSPIKELSEEEKNHIKAWTKDHPENIWELSGQFEGDIILLGSRRNGIVSTSRRWPATGSIVQIPYMFEDGFPENEKNIVINALQVYVSKTCIRPVLITTPSVTDYVHITGSGSGCFSYIGRTGGRQQLNLQSGTGCFTNGTIQHEFLHTVGFLHQQSATERDDYVTIIKENIRPEALPNFDKYSSSLITNFNTTYDYGSVMHYGPYAFSANGNKTIITKDPNAEIGQRVGLSDTDILKVNRMYNCTLS